MSRVEELNDVPSSEVNQVSSDYEDEGAQVERIPQPDGKWTVRATFPE